MMNYIFIKYIDFHGIEKHVIKTYDQTLKDLSLEDDEDLIGYFDWIINNQDISNKKIEH